MKIINSEGLAVQLMSQIIIEKMKQKSEKLHFYKYALQMLKEMYDEDYESETGVCYIMQYYYIPSVVSKLGIETETTGKSGFSKDMQQIFYNVKGTFCGKAHLFCELYEKATTPYEPYFFAYHEERIDALEEVIREMEKNNVL